MRVVLASVLFIAAAATVLRAGDQTILGQKIQVKDPGAVEKRKIVAAAKEKLSPDTLVGDPVANGASLTITANGGTPSSQTYPLPTGTSSISGKPFWTGDPVKGFKYTDSKGAAGPVKKVQIKKSSSGVFQIKVAVDGKLGSVAVVPPNPGTDACLLLEITGGDSYSAKFAAGDGEVKNDGTKLFKISKPTQEGTCVVVTTTTNTTALPTTSTSTTTDTSTTTSPCPTGQTLCGATCVDTSGDAANCGACGNDCNAGAVNATFTCQSNACVFAGCLPNFWDLDGNHTCEYACTFTSPTESCNGLDDDCDGQIDEGIPPPSPSAVCGVSPTATTPECTSQVTVACASGAWQCTFPAGVCTGGCANAAEVCDGLDNDCDGSVDETFPALGTPCASDDALPPPGDGPCRTTGTYVCNGPNAVACNAVKANCATLPGGCTELPDGIDNDCDGSIDEPFNAKGANAAFFVKPVVTKVAATVWMYSYEASRPTATSTSPGQGNGYVTSAPAGVTYDRTPPASVAGRLPWFNATGAEAEQACSAVGGHLCTTAEYQTSCQATASCVFGYAPRGVACQTSFTGTKYCNLGLSYDFDGVAGGDQDGLLPTASATLQACWSDWSALQGNGAATSKIFDTTGNLRELTKAATNTYDLMGGSFLSQVEAGGTCTFTSYVVDQNFAFADTGFRCCFSADPTQ